MMEDLFIYETCKLKTVLIVSICVKTDYIIAWSLVLKIIYLWNLRLKSDLNDWNLT